MLVEQRIKENKKLTSYYTSAYKQCSKLHQMQFKDIQTAHIQEIIDNLNRSYSSKKL